MVSPDPSCLADVDIYKCSLTLEGKVLVELAVSHFESVEYEFSFKMEQRKKSF